MLAAGVLCGVARLAAAQAPGVSATAPKVTEPAPADSSPSASTSPSSLLQGDPLAGLPPSRSGTANGPGGPFDYPVEDSMSVFEPASPPAGIITEQFYLLLAVTGVIFLLVGGMIVWCLLRFRERRGQADVEPPQIYGSSPIEVAWTLIPALIVFVLFLVVARSVFDLDRTEPSEGALEVHVIGHQWWWEYRYYPGDSELGFTTANELVLPADGREIFLKLDSADVLHSFWVPRLNGKTDLIPAHHNHLWFSIDSKEPVTFYGQCAEYCGAQHTNMKLRIDAVAKEDFERWAQQQRAEAFDDPSVAAGRKLFEGLGCANCHTIRGTNGNGTFGPDLTHLGSRRTIAAGAAFNNEANLTLWIHDPDNIKPGSRMPDMHLDEQQVQALVAYLMSLK